MPRRHALVGRRFLLQGSGALIITLVGPRVVSANPFADQPLHARAKILRQSTVVVPRTKASSPPGLTGADVDVQARGVFGIDWVMAGRDTITLMLLSGSQKNQLMSARQISGDPLMRFEIEGPETAGHSVNVQPGRYFIAFLNGSTSDVRILYRASLVPF
jgi:hypothetical protein